MATPCPPAEPNPGDGYTRIDHDDGRIEFVPVPRYGVDWQPNYRSKYFYVNSCGCVSEATRTCSAVELQWLNFHNAYPTKEHAERAAELLREAYADVWRTR